MSNNDTLSFSVSVPLPPAAAFDRFTSGLNAWWPPAYSWAGDVLEEIGMEPEEGGMLFERGPHGFTCHWGRVLAWNPPRSVRFTWQIAPDRVPEPDPARASVVTVRFTASDGQSTDVMVTHGHFENHGEGSDAYRQGLASEEGWPFMLARYVDACS